MMVALSASIVVTTPGGRPRRSAPADQQTNNDADTGCGSHRHPGVMVDVSEISVCVRSVFMKHSCQLWLIAKLIAWHESSSPAYEISFLT